MTAQIDRKPSFTFIDYAKILRRSWVTLVSIVLGFVIVGALLALLLPRSYDATATLYVSAQAGDSSANSAYQGSLLSEQRVKSYTQLVRGERVAGAVRSQLGLTQPSSQISQQITASSQVDSVVFTITASDASPEVAAAMANAASQSLTEIVAEIERPIDATRPPSVAVRTVEPAQVPQQASFPNVPILLVGALGLGLVAGVSAVLLWNAVDTTLRTPEDAAEAAGSVVLGRTLDASRRPSALIADEDANSVLVEPYRKLRNNLAFLNIDSALRSIVVTSPSPGEGKTTFVTNLAMAISNAGHSVLVMDCDLRKPKIAEYLGLEGHVGVTSILSGRVTLVGARQSWRGNFDVLPSGPIPPNPSEVLGSERMRDLLSEATSLYDTVLLDSAPVLPVADAATVAALCDTSLLLCRSNVTKRENASGAASALRKAGASVSGVVLTMARPDRSEGYGRYYGPSASVGAHRIGVHDNGAVTQDIPGAAESLKRPSPNPRIR